MNRKITLGIFCLSFLMVSNLAQGQDADAQNHQPVKQQLGPNQGVPMSKGGVTFELRQKSDVLLVYVTGEAQDIVSVGKGKATIKTSKKTETFENIKYENGFYSIIVGKEEFKGIVKFEAKVNDVLQSVEWKL
jgi:hypothetical protein